MRIIKIGIIFSLFIPSASRGGPGVTFRRILEGFWEAVGSILDCFLSDAGVFVEGCLLILGMLAGFPAGLLG